MMRIPSIAPFGTTSCGNAVSQITLDNGILSCQVLTYGAVLRTLCVPDRNGEQRDVVLGYDTLKEYEQDTAYLGAIVGRCANRIAFGKFSLNGKDYVLACNNGPNHLHGGELGFAHQVWNISRMERNLVELSLFSSDGQDGYPGNLMVKVTYELLDSTLQIRYWAETDADTLCNLTNHSYFNLSGHNSGHVLEQKLRICADWFTPSDADSVPFGNLVSVTGTPMDFLVPHPIGAYINEPFDQLIQGRGYDHNYVVNGTAGTLREAAHADSEESGISMTALTTTPGMHFYTANYIEMGCQGKDGSIYGPRHGFCLEMQYFPDAINQTNFISPVLKAGEVYDHTSRFTFSYI